jgi:hypothetical protein
VKKSSKKRVEKVENQKLAVEGAGKEIFFFFRIDTKFEKFHNFFRFSLIFRQHCGGHISQNMRKT